MLPAALVYRPRHDDIVEVDSPARAPRGANAIHAHTREEGGNQTGASSGFGTLSAQHLHIKVVQVGGGGAGASARGGAIDTRKAC